jgi:FKBP-type peptidyl-prolyl cis-trans isomerase FkpA
MAARLCITSVFAVAAARPAQLGPRAALLSLRGGARLASDDDRALYALGCNVGRQVGDLDCFHAQEIDTILLGIRDTLARSDLEVNVAEHMPRAMELFKERQDAFLEKVVASSTEVLTAAAAESNAITTESGLVVKHLSDGKGKSPTPTSTVKVHYTGTLPDGKVFDSSITRGEPIEFKLGDVVQGWQEGLQLMKVGGKAVLTIPADLGYGEQGKSIIPPKSALIFEVELLEIIGDA